MHGRSRSIRSAPPIVISKQALKEAASSHASEFQFSLSDSSPETSKSLDTPTPDSILNNNDFDTPSFDSVLNSPKSLSQGFDPLLLLGNGDDITSPFLDNSFDMSSETTSDRQSDFDTQCSSRKFFIRLTYDCRSTCIIKRPFFHFFFAY